MYLYDGRGDRCFDNERWRGTCIRVFIVVKVKGGWGKNE